MAPCLISKTFVLTQQHVTYKKHISTPYSSHLRIFTTIWDTYAMDIK